MCETLPPIMLVLVAIDVEGLMTVAPAEDGSVLVVQLLG
jgi:hypothetical protein